MDTKNIQKGIDAKITEAKSLPPAKGMLRSVFCAKRLDESIHIGCNYQPNDTQIGDQFHYDHGAGIYKNNDAEVVWLETY